MYCSVFILMHGNGYVYGVVWRFEARTCQTVIKFIRCNTLDISTIRQMHYTRCYRLVFIHFSLFLSICYYFSVCRAWGQTHLLTSFGCAVGFLSDLAMCVAVKRWHVLLIIFHFYLIYNVFHCRFFVFLNRHLYSCFGYL